MESSLVEQQIDALSGDARLMTSTTVPNFMERASTDIDCKTNSTFATNDQNACNSGNHDEVENETVIITANTIAPLTLLLPPETCANCLRGELQLYPEEFNIVQHALREHANEWRFENCGPSVHPVTKKSKGSRGTAAPTKASSTPTLSQGRIVPQCVNSTPPMVEKSQFVPQVIMHAMKEGASSSHVTQGTSKETQRTNITGAAAVALSESSSTAPELDGRGIDQTNIQTKTYPPNDTEPLASLTSLSGGNTSETLLAQSKRRPLSSQVKLNLPEWANCLHGLLVDLSQLPVCPQLLFQPINPYEAQQRSTPKRLLPLDFINLEGILGKLEAGTYTHCSEALNDVCKLFDSAFRYYMPGSVLWMNTHETSQFFLENLRKFPILAEGCRLCGDLSSIVNWKQRHDTSVDETIQMMILKGREKKKKMEAAASTTFAGGAGGKESRVDSPQGAKKRKPYKPRSRGGKRPESGKTGSRLRATPYLIEGNLDAPIMDEERADFQNLLLKLNQDQHFALFSEYQQRAVWRTLDGGEVELDDRGTAPHIFRDMVIWCRQQLTTPHILPSQKAYFDTMPSAEAMADSGYGGEMGHSRVAKRLEYTQSYESDEDSSETSSGSEDSDSGRS